MLLSWKHCFFLHLRLGNSSLLITLKVLRACIVCDPQHSSLFTQTVCASPSMPALVKHWMLTRQLWGQWCSRTLFRISGWSKSLRQGSELISKSEWSLPDPSFFSSSFCFLFSSSYLVFLNSKVVGSNNKVQEFKLFTDLVNRCLVTVPTRYPIPFSTADYWTNYEFHNKVKMSLWTVFIQQAVTF